MNWMEALYKTYEDNAQRTGLNSSEEKNSKNRTITPLFPLYHGSQNAQVTVVLDGSGAFRRAEVVPAGNQQTIIPVTEKSGGRTSGLCPHPLCDKLQYVAGDFTKWTGNTKPGTKNISTNWSVGKILILPMQRFLPSFCMYPKAVFWKTSSNQEFFP